MKTYTCTLRSGINRTPEFEKKGLAQYAVNIGTRCGHECTYCSSPALLRMHSSIKRNNLNPFQRGYSIVDPTTPERIKRDAARIKKRGLVQLCTTVDAWSPEAQEYNLGRRCLEAILAEPGWTVRILTKNASVINDYDIIKKYRDRITLGITITSTQDKEDIIKVIEPNASLISERIDALNAAASRNIKVFAMFCPLLPGICNDTENILRLIQHANSWNVNEIFAEAVNARGNGLILTQKSLEEAGLTSEAADIQKIRNRSNWNDYVVNLIQTIQNVTRNHSDINKLKFLQYSSGLHPRSIDIIQKDESGIVWL